MRGWHLGYPETTGYMIETLLKFDPLFPDLQLKRYAENSAEWLLTQQLPNGSFPALLAGNQTPSFFNSGMIVFGLLEIDSINPRDDLKNSLCKLAAWLHSVDWEEIIYKAPSYYTRALWAYHLLACYLEDGTLTAQVKTSMETICKRITEEHTLKSWGFDGKDRAFSHTIAYTWRGIFEYGRLAKQPEYIAHSTHFLTKLTSVYNQKNSLAGSYDQEWKGDHSYVCITGNAQLSYFAQEAGLYLQHKGFITLGKLLFEDILNLQHSGRIDSELKGAVAGSSPIWGAYMRFKYPNWAVKFYLDALFHYWKKTNSIIA